MSKIRNPNRLYGSYLVLHPDNSPMFRCGQEKAEWYLSRNLAELVADDPPVLKFKFVPKGRGHSGDTFYLSKKENRCVVCGHDNLEDLTRHHVVPYCYRKFFPPKAKRNNYHDVLLLCEECHQKYEEKAQQMKKDLAVKYDAPLGFVAVDPKKHQARKFALALYAWGQKMPQSRVEQLKEWLREYLGHDPNSEELFKLSNLCYSRSDPFGEHGRNVITKIPNLQDFVVMWRNHFIMEMKPLFLPDYWDTNRDYLDNGHEEGDE